MGLYRTNPDLFAGIEFTESMEGLDLETLVWNILAECAELEILYPDPDFMQAMIARWSAARMHAWERMYSALYQEYNPLWNKDAHILETVTTGPEKETRTYGQKQESTAWGARSASHILGARHGEGTNLVSAFNSSTYEPSEKSTSDQNSATDTSSELAHTDTTTENQHIDTSETLEHYVENERTEQGNIGVTTSQQMAEAEMKLRAAYDMYNIIVTEFKQRFCLLVY